MSAGFPEIRTLLIANRGEVACRIIRTARDMGIRAVCVYSDIDVDEPFVRDADLAVALGGTAPTESYLRTDAIIEAALRTGCDAVHPGYGFLAENAAFAEACARAGLVFVGPSVDAIERMGSKLLAKRLLAPAGVPMLPDADVTGMEGRELATAADAVGYPLLIKPSAGGGGKGMRIVSDPDELATAVAASRREARAAFGDDALLLEAFVESGRHVEVQILGDHYGTVTHLHERECSVQRRHQKVLEETPAVGLDATLLGEMTSAAVAAGEAIGYVGAGTVEFLLNGEKFYFLEMNTRLQVEHPVTEATTGLDLVRLQLEIAAGAPIGDDLRPPPRSGHAIEVRLYAEDPAADFLPQTGRLHHLLIPSRRGIRVDSGVTSGSEISIHYDPMIAKVIAHASSRREAARLLAATLRASEIDGVRTNRDFLVHLLEDPAFLDGGIDTGFLDRADAKHLIEPLLSAEDLGLCAAAAALAGQAQRRESAKVQVGVPSGWRNVPSTLERIAYTAHDGEHAIGYRFHRGELEALEINGRSLTDARLLLAGPHEVILLLEGVRSRYSVRAHGGVVCVSGPEGQCELREVERYPGLSLDAVAGSLHAPMPGTVVRVDAKPGDAVTAGQPLLVLEAMKMEHEIVAPSDGVLTALPVSVGDQVAVGTLLAAIDDSEVEAATRGQSATGRSDPA